MRIIAYSRTIVAMLLCCVIAAFSVHGVKSQTRITFCVDLQEMIDSGYFKAGEDKIVVRGTFNNWSGMAPELFPDPDLPLHYCNDFMADVEEGGRIEYKYTIVTADGREYWEVNPNPDNQGYGNRVLEINGNAVKAGISRFDYGEEIKGRMLPWPAKLQADFMQMRMLVESNHPALYDYTPKAELDSLFDHYYAMIDASTDIISFYKYISDILAHIGCGHTKLWIPGSYWEAAPDHFFPLKLLLTGDKVLVTGSYDGDKSLPLGSELIMINDIPLDEIISEMKVYESSDGFIDAFKTSSVQKRFPFRYAILYGFPDTFNISYLLPESRKIEKAALMPTTISNLEVIPNRPKVLTFNMLEDQNAGLMTINTFGYYSEVPMFRAFIDSSFQVLKDKNADNLIIDLRGNDGGDPWCASYLFSYLQKEPVPYFAETYHHYEDLAKPMPLPENHYSGDVFVLIDGGCFSTTGHLIGLLDYHNLVRFVGEESGATFTCTGNVNYVNLNNTGFILGTARESRYTAAVKGMNPRQGIIPDYPVETTASDLAEDRDAPLTYTLELIGRQMR